MDAVARAVFTQAQAEGLTLRYSDNAAGFAQVYQSGGRFCAHVSRGGKSVHLGSFVSADEAALHVARESAEADCCHPPSRHPPWTAASASAVWDGARGDGGPGDVWRVRGWGGGNATGTGTANAGTANAGAANAGAASGDGRLPQAMASGFAPPAATAAPPSRQRSSGVAVAVRVGDVLGRSPGMAAATAAAAAAAATAAAAAGAAPAAAAACAKCGAHLGPWNVHTCGACHAVLYCGAECQEVC